MNATWSIIFTKVCYTNALILLNFGLSKSQNPIGLLMIHRHLNHQRFTLAAIDDIISRGQPDDWAELRRAVLADQSLLDKVMQICRVYISDPYAQRYHFWMHYAKKHSTPA
jgi:hypothetical protein